MVVIGTDNDVGDIIGRGLLLVGESGAIMRELSRALSNCLWTKVESVVEWTTSLMISSRVN